MRAEPGSGSVLLSAHGDRGLRPPSQAFGHPHGRRFRLQPKRWVVIPEANHNDLGPQRSFWEPIWAFLDAARAG